MSLTGTPIIYGISPHNAGAEQMHPLGSRGVTNDGRIYRYVQNASTAIVPGKLCVAPDITTNHEDRAVNTFAIGDRSITVTLGSTAITGNEYEEGLVNITDDTGEGIMYKIRSCPPTDSGGTVTILLAEPIVIAAVDNTTVTLYRNKYRDIIVSDGTQADLPVGVPNITIAIDNYGWVQTGGPCSILVDSNDTTAGSPITIGANADGAVETRNANTEVIVGTQPVGNNAVAGEYGIYELRLD